MDEKSQKYLTNYNLLTVQDLWQAHYQILLIILLKELIKLSVSMDIIMRYVKHAELNTKIVRAALNTQSLKMIQ